MADPRYAIDAPVAPDLTPGISMFLAARNQHRANKRSDEYLGMERDAMKRNAERQSAQDVRDAEELKRKHDIEAFTNRDAVFRLANKSPEAANINPYGFHFDVAGDQLPAGTEGPMYPTAEAARFVMGGGPMGKPAPATPDASSELDQALADASGAAQPANPGVRGARNERDLPRNVEGPELSPLGEAEKFAPPGAADPELDNLMMGASPDARRADEVAAMPTDVRSMAAANAFGSTSEPPARRVIANYQGHSFEVPQESEKTPFGPQYDEMLKFYLDDGADPKEARKAVAAQYKADQGQKAIADRVASQIDSRRELQGGRQDFTRSENEKYKETHAGRMELVDEAGKFKVQAAAPGLKADAANSRDMGLLRQQGAAIRNTSQFGKLAANDKTVRGLMANIATGAVPLAHADAQIQLARFFRQAQPTEGEMHMLYNNLGGTADKWNQFVARMSKGDLSAEQMRQLRASAKTVQHEHEQDKQRFADVARHMLGPGSGFDMMPDQAQQLYEGMGSELGIKDLPPLYTTEGGVTLGTGKRPTVAPRGTKRTQLDEIESYLDSLGGQGGR